MDAVIGVVVGLVIGLIAGTVWGRLAEQKAVAAVMAEFRLIDAETKSAVNRLLNSLPWLRKHLGL
jgi:hypothetical protein